MHACTAMLCCRHYNGMVYLAANLLTKTHPLTTLCLLVLISSYSYQTIHIPMSLRSTPLLLLAKLIGLFFWKPFEKKNSNLVRHTVCNGPQILTAQWTCPLLNLATCMARVIVLYEGYFFFQSGTSLSKNGVTSEFINIISMPTHYPKKNVHD